MMVDLNFQPPIIQKRPKNIDPLDRTGQLYRISKQADSASPRFPDLERAISIELSSFRSAPTPEQDRGRGGRRSVTISVKLFERLPFETIVWLSVAAISTISFLWGPTAGAFPLTTLSLLLGGLFMSLMAAKREMKKES